MKDFYHAKILRIKANKEVEEEVKWDLMSIEEFDSPELLKGSHSPHFYCQQYMAPSLSTDMYVSKDSEIWSNDFLFDYFENHIQIIRDFYNTVCSIVNKDIEEANQTPKADLWKLNSIKGDSILEISLLKKLSTFSENADEWNLNECDDVNDKINKEIKKFP